jgi:hypothetical protein
MDDASIEVPDTEEVTYACAARECRVEATMMVPALRLDNVTLQVQLGNILLDPGAPFAVPLCDRHAREM